MLGAYVSPMQYVGCVPDRLVIIPDGDMEGYKAADRIVDQVGKKISTEMYKTPKGLDPDQLSADVVDDTASILELTIDPIVCSY